jgi:hypothetical protein
MKAGSRAGLPAFKYGSPPQRRALEQLLRTHERYRRASARRDRARRRIISIPNRDGSTLHSHVALPIVGGVPGVADVPIPIQQAIHHVRHILGISRAPVVWAVGLGSTSGQPQTGHTQTASHQCSRRQPQNSACHKPDVIPPGSVAGGFAVGDHFFPYRVVARPGGARVCASGYQPRCYRSQHQDRTGDADAGPKRFLR